MYIYKLTQEYVKVRKLGQDFKDFIWRGLRIHPHSYFITGFINSLVTKVKNNMKNSLMCIADKILLRKRVLIEMVNDELKSNST